MQIEKEENVQKTRKFSKVVPQWTKSQGKNKIQRMIIATEQQLKVKETQLLSKG